MDIAAIISGIISNPVVIAIIATFTALYTSTIGPTLPPEIKNLFSNDIFKFSVVFATAYLASARKPVIALVSAFSFLFITSLMTQQNVFEKFKVEGRSRR